MVPMLNFVKNFSLDKISLVIFSRRILLIEHQQGSHRPEKYLKLEGFLEKSLKIKSALKNNGKHSKALKSP